MHAKLPKLSITKFDWSFEQWLSFLNKFSAKIDVTDLPAVGTSGHRWAPVQL